MYFLFVGDFAVDSMIASFILVVNCGWRFAIAFEMRSSAAPVSATVSPMSSMMGKSSFTSPMAVLIRRARSRRSRTLRSVRRS